MITRSLQRDSVRVDCNLKTSRDDPEPSLAELFDDPLLHAVMARDGVSRAHLEAVVDRARRRLGLAADGDRAFPQSELTEREASPAPALQPAPV